MRACCIERDAHFTSELHKESSATIRCKPESVNDFETLSFTNY